MTEGSLKRYLAALILLLSGYLSATTVTGTIQDINGNRYANGTVSAFSVITGASMTPAATDANGTFSITLTPSTYTFTVCAKPVNIGPSTSTSVTQVCAQPATPIVISGGSQDVSTQINAVAPILGPSVAAFLGANNAFTGNNSYAGTETMNGQTTFNGLVALNNILTGAGSAAIAGTFGGSPTMTGAWTLSGGGSLSGTWGGSPTTTGNWTMQGNNTFTGSNTFTQLQGCQWVNANQSFAAALVAAGTSGCIAISPGTWPVSVNASTPAGVTLDMVDGGVLSIANGVTLNINGGFLAPYVQVFTYVGTGVVSFNNSVGQPWIQAVWFPGATADVQITNCLNSISNEGTCDARGFSKTATLVFANTVTVNTGQTLLCDPATPFTPQSASTNFFNVNSSARVQGCWLDIGAQSSYSGTFFKFPANYTDGESTLVEQIRITGAASALWTGFDFTSTVSHNIAFVELRNIRMFGGLDGIRLACSGASTVFTNGNHFDDVHVSLAVNGVHFNAAGSGCALDGNQFSNYSYEKSSGGSSNVAIRMDWSAGVCQRNLFNNMVSWDTVTNAVTIPSGGCAGNSFIGRMDGATPVNDPGNNNDWIEFLSNVARFNNMSWTINNANSFFNHVFPIPAGSVMNNAVNPWGSICLGQTTNNSNCLGGTFTGNLTANLPSVSGTLVVGIASGTAAMTTAGISTGACGTTVTVGATGVLTTDSINISHNAAVTIGNGGGLTLNAWPTAGNVNFNYCNSAAGTITPTAMTINWQVTR